jgi:Glycosyl hydrolase family 63 C-terminal domain
MINDGAINKVRAMAVAVLESNRRCGRSRGLNLPYDYTCPSPSTYPFQWCWDSCFHAITLCHFDIPRAQEEISSLLRAIHPDGFLPHMVMWQDELRANAIRDFPIALSDTWRTATIAPPVLARAIRRVYTVSGDRAWLAEVVPSTVQFFEWLAIHRGHAATKLLHLYQPDESGMDMSPKYDRRLKIDDASCDTVSARWHRVMAELIDAYGIERKPSSDLNGHGRFIWYDVLVNSIYADGLNQLSELVVENGDGDDLATALQHRFREVVSSLIRECWDEDSGVFWDRDGISGDQVRVLTVSSLFPLILPELPARIAQRLVDEHLLNEAEFWTPYPVPSVAVSEPSFDADFVSRGIFRGSSWVNLNWYLYWGLRAHGRSDVARALAHRTITMIAEAGLRECYGPYSGKGQGAHQFGWSSLIVDLAHAEGL